MVAFEQDLATSANAHQLMAELTEARARITCPGEGEDSDGQHGAVECATEGRIQVQHHRFEISRFEISDLVSTCNLQSSIRYSRSHRAVARGGRMRPPYVFSLRRLLGRRAPLPVR